MFRRQRSVKCVTILDKKKRRKSSQQVQVVSLRKNSKTREQNGLDDVKTISNVKRKSKGHNDYKGKPSRTSVEHQGDPNVTKNDCYKKLHKVARMYEDNGQMKWVISNDDIRSVLGITEGKAPSEIKDVKLTQHKGHRHTEKAHGNGHGRKKSDCASHKDISLSEIDATLRVRLSQMGLTDFRDVIFCPKSKNVEMDNVYYPSQHEMQPFDSDGYTSGTVQFNARVVIPAKCLRFGPEEADPEGEERRGSDTADIHHYKRSRILSITENVSQETATIDGLPVQIIRSDGSTQVRFLVSEKYIQVEATSDDDSDGEEPSESPGAWEDDSGTLFPKAKDSLVLASENATKKLLSQLKECQHLVSLKEAGDFGSTLGERLLELMERVGIDNGDVYPHDEDLGVKRLVSVLEVAKASTEDLGLVGIVLKHLHDRCADRLRIEGLGLKEKFYILSGAIACKLACNIQALYPSFSFLPRAVVRPTRDNVKDIVESTWNSLVKSCPCLEGQDSLKQASRVILDETLKCMRSSSSLDFLSAVSVVVRDTSNRLAEELSSRVSEDSATMFLEKILSTVESIGTSKGFQFSCHGGTCINQFHNVCDAAVELIRKHLHEIQHDTSVNNNAFAFFPVNVNNNAPGTRQSSGAIGKHSSAHDTSHDRSRQQRIVFTIPQKRYGRAPTSDDPPRQNHSISKKRRKQKKVFIDTSRRTLEFLRTQTMKTLNATSSEEPDNTAKGDVVEETSSSDDSQSFQGSEAEDKSVDDSFLIEQAVERTYAKVCAILAEECSNISPKSSTESVPFLAETPDIDDDIFRLFDVPLDQVQPEALAASLNSICTTLGGHGYTERLKRYEHYSSRTNYRPLSSCWLGLLRSLKNAVEKYKEAENRDLVAISSHSNGRIHEKLSDKILHDTLPPEGYLKLALRVAEHRKLYVPNKQPQPMKSLPDVFRTSVERMRVLLKLDMSSVNLSNQMVDCLAHVLKDSEGDDVGWTLQEIVRTLLICCKGDLNGVQKNLERIFCALGTSAKTASVIGREAKLILGELDDLLCDQMRTGAHSNLRDTLVKLTRMPSQKIHTSHLAQLGAAMLLYYDVCVKDDCTHNGVRESKSEHSLSKMVKSEYTKMKERICAPLDKGTKRSGDESDSCEDRTHEERNWDCVSLMTIRNMSKRIAEAVAQQNLFRNLFSHSVEECTSAWKLLHLAIRENEKNILSNCREIRKQHHILSVDCLVKSVLEYIGRPLIDTCIIPLYVIETIHDVFHRIHRCNLQIYDIKLLCDILREYSQESGTFRDRAEFSIDEKTLTKLSRATLSKITLLLETSLANKEHHLLLNVADNLREISHQSSNVSLQSCSYSLTQEQQAATTSFAEKISKRLQEEVCTMENRSFSSDQNKCVVNTTLCGKLTDICRAIHKRTLDPEIEEEFVRIIRCSTYMEKRSKLPDLEQLQYLMTVVTRDIETCPLTLDDMNNTSPEEEFRKSVYFRSVLCVIARLIEDLEGGHLSLNTILALSRVTGSTIDDIKGLTKKVQIHPSVDNTILPIPAEKVIQALSALSMKCDNDTVQKYDAVERFSYRNLLQPNLREHPELIPDDNSSHHHDGDQEDCEMVDLHESHDVLKTGVMDARGSIVLEETKNKAHVHRHDKTKKTTMSSHCNVQVNANNSREQRFELETSNLSPMFSDMCNELIGEAVNFENILVKPATSLRRCRAEDGEQPKDGAKTPDISVAKSAREIEFSTSCSRQKNDLCTNERPKSSINGSSVVGDKESRISIVCCSYCGKGRNKKRTSKKGRRQKCIIIPRMKSEGSTVTSRTSTATTSVVAPRTPSSASRVPSARNSPVCTCTTLGRKTILTPVRDPVLKPTGRSSIMISRTVRLPPVSSYRRAGGNKMAIRDTTTRYLPSQSTPQKFVALSSQLIPPLSTQVCSAVPSTVVPSVRVPIKR